MNRRWLGVAALFLVLTLAGCDGDDSGGSGGEAGANPEPPPCTQGVESADASCVRCIYEAVREESCAEQATECFITPELFVCAIPCGFNGAEHPPTDLSCLLEKCPDEFWPQHGCFVEVCEGYSACF